MQEQGAWLLFDRQLSDAAQLWHQLLLISRCQCCPFYFIF